jgi:uncharacterized protein
VSSNQSRRKFLQTGLALPAAGLASSALASSAIDQTAKTAAPRKTPKLPAQMATPEGVVYRTLGKTGLQVSGVGFGIGFEPVPDVVARALDMGINYYDTSRDYNQSENVFSGVIKGRKRDKIVIATKSPNREKAKIIEDLDTSLKALGTDYVDIWHLHARDKPANIPDEAIEAMEICKKSGKARFIGFSCHDPNSMADWVVKNGKFDVVQTTYSFAIGSYYRDAAIKKIHNAGLGIIAMKVVVALSGLKLEGFDNPPKSKEEGGPLAGIKWVLKNPAIGTTVPNMRTIPQLEMNFRAMKESFTPADEKLLYVMNEDIRPTYCRMCYQCDGKCPKGLPVTDMLRYLAYNDYCGSFHQAVANLRGLSNELREVKCSDCESCAIKCPNGVHVRERLIRAQSLMA